MVLAGPGSGKTAVVTARTAELIKKGVSPGNILVVTFTKAAADEMERRFQSGYGDVGGSGKVTFGTFHSIFYKILKFAYNLNSSNILKTIESNMILRRIFDFLRVETGNRDSLLDEVKAEISAVKSFSKDIKTYFATSMEPEMFRNVFIAYEKELRRRRLYDFDDMLIETYRLLAARSDILERWCDKYQYIMVDEFQDINNIQYETIKLLAGENKNLFVVGDDDQSIYGFRGSDPRIMKEFTIDYPRAEVITLGVNHRSGTDIVNTAERLISKNKNRFPKEITAYHTDGMPVEVMRFEDCRREAEFIEDKVMEFHRRGVPFGEIAILSRTASELHNVIGCLASKNVPFAVKDRITGLYSHFVSKDIVSYIKFSVGDRSKDTFMRIANRPNRYISRDMLGQGEVDIDKLKDAAASMKYIFDRLDRLEYDLSFIAKGTPKAAIIYIRRAVGYDGFLKGYAKEHGIHEEELYDILDRLIEDADEFKTHEEWFEHIKLVEDSIRVQAENNRNRKKDEVTLSTMHASKGLEYRIVFILNANENVTPYKKAILEGEQEEERRLFYVAMTRAKSRLFICYCDRLHGKKAEVSRYVKEMGCLRKNKGV